MHALKVNDQTELRMIEHQHCGALFKLLDANREYLRVWHPWVDTMQAIGAVERAVATWQQQYSNKRGAYAGIWYNGNL